MIEAHADTDRTARVLEKVRDQFGEDFVSGRVEAERAAVALLNQRAGEFDRVEATRLGQLFNSHSKAGRARLDRFSPAFAGATMQKATGDLERFNQVVADLWTAPFDTALETLGRMCADRSLLPGAGSSLPSMLLYLRNPDQYGVCINATMGGLKAALACPPFRADSRAGFERFCDSLARWRQANEIAPQEADAVLTALGREVRDKEKELREGSHFGDGPLRFLADLADNNNGEWMQANQHRYQTELRQPFVDLLEQIADRHMRELDPRLDTAIKANRVLANIRKRFPDSEGEYYGYLWGAFSRGRKQEDVQLAVMAHPHGLEASLFFGSATADQVLRLREAVSRRGDELLASVSRYRDRLTWDVEDREHPFQRPRQRISVAAAPDVATWLDAGGTSIRWTIPLGDPLLADPHLADEIGALFRALHPIAAAAWGDSPRPLPVSPSDDGEPTEQIESDRLSIEEVAERCYLSPETVEGWVNALNGAMRQGLFFGPPGTGKTFVATTLARHLATSSGHVELVQFHASYSYEDFIEGLRPDLSSDSGMLQYTVRPGLFQNLCAKARAAASETFVLIIDEMNRADVAAVFGELMLLLEYRGTRSVALPYSQLPFSIPRNLVVLATMNTADRSLALVDFALRRRFNAFPLHPDHDVLAAWAKAHSDIDSELVLSIFDLVRDRLGPESPVAPGHSYWMVDDADVSTLERIWTYQVRPYLAEHWFERPDELDQLDEEVTALLSERS